MDFNVIPNLQKSLNGKTNLIVIFVQSNHFIVMSKLIFTFSLLIISVPSLGQMGLQEVITDYENLRTSIKVVKVDLPENTQAAFYRITVFQREKVNTTESLLETLRLINPKKITDDATYNFAQHNLNSNGLAPVDAYFFTDEKDANAFKSKNTSENSCFNVAGIRAMTGKLECAGKQLFIAVKPTSKEPVTVKIEVVALSGERSYNSYDRYPYSIQNETNGEVVYEISGERVNWEIFHLPSLKKADFKLAKSSVYLRVSTREKITVEYFIESGKKYRLFWNEELFRVDLAESGKKVIDNE